MRFAGKSEEELLKAVNQVQVDTTATFQTVPLLELIRRAVSRLNDSSRRLERITLVVLALTAVLVVLTAVLAWLTFRLPLYPLAK
jgi:hypothetical protein